MSRMRLVTDDVRLVQPRLAGSKRGGIDARQWRDLRTLREQVLINERYRRILLRHRRYDGDCT